MKNEQVCTKCLKKFDARDDEDIYETENFGNAYICKNCIGPMAKQDLGDEANN